MHNGTSLGDFRLVTAAGDPTTLGAETPGGAVIVLMRHIG